MNDRTKEVRDMTLERIESNTIKEYLTNNNIELTIEDCITIIYNSSDCLENKYIILDTISEMLRLGLIPPIKLDVWEQLVIAITDIKKIVELLKSNNKCIFAKYSNGEIYCANSIENIKAKYGDEINIFNSNGNKEFLLYLNKKGLVSGYKMVSRDTMILSQYVNIKNDINIGDTVYDLDEVDEDKSEFIVINKSEALNYTYNDNVVMVVPKRIFEGHVKVRDTIEKTYTDRIKNFFNNDNNDVLDLNISNIHITRVERIQRYEE